METPRLVLDAFLVEPLRVAGLDLQPFTLRRWMRLEADGNPLLHFHVPEDPLVRLDAVLGAAAILSELRSPFSDLPSPSDFDDLTEAVLQVIGLGFSTALKMEFPGDTGEALPADLVDLFGLPTRLLAHAVKRIGMDVAAALDIPTCQLFILIAGGDALDGKVPIGKNYRQRNLHSATAGPDQNAERNPEKERAKNKGDGH